MLTDAQRADHAKLAINNPILQEAFAKLSAAYLTAARKSLPKDKDGSAYYLEGLSIIEAVQSHLKQVLDTGEIDAAQLTEENPYKPKGWRVFG